MFGIILRELGHAEATTKGSVLSFTELDGNFLSLLDRIINLEENTIKNMQLDEIAYVTSEGGKTTSIQKDSNNSVIGKLSSVLSGSNNSIESLNSSIIASSNAILSASANNSAVIACDEKRVYTEPFTLYTSNIKIKNNITLGDTPLDEETLKEIIDRDTNERFIFNMYNNTEDILNLNIVYNDNSTRKIPLNGVRQYIAETETYVSEGIYRNNGILFSYNNIDDKIFVDLCQFRDEILFDSEFADARLTNAYIIKKRLYLEITEGSTLLQKIEVDLSDSYEDNRLVKAEYKGNSVVNFLIEDADGNPSLPVFLDLKLFKDEILCEDKYLVSASFDEDSYLICYEGSNYSIPPTNLSIIRNRFNKLDNRLNEIEANEDFAVNGFFDNSNYQVSVNRQLGGEFKINLSGIKKDIEEVRGLDDFVRNGILRVKENTNAYELVLNRQLGEDIIIPFNLISNRLNELDAKYDNLMDENTFITGGTFNNYTLALEYNDNRTPLFVEFNELKKEFAKEEHIISLEFDDTEFDIIATTNLNKTYKANLNIVKERINSLENNESFLKEIKITEPEDQIVGIPQEFQYTFIIRNQENEVVDELPLVLSGIFDYINNLEDYVVEGNYDNSGNNIELFRLKDFDKTSPILINLDELTENISKNDFYIKSTVFNNDTFNIEYLTSPNEYLLSNTNLMGIRDYIDFNDTYLTSIEEDNTFDSDLPPGFAYKFDITNNNFPNQTKVLIDTLHLDLTSVRDYIDESIETANENLPDDSVISAVELRDSNNNAIPFRYVLEKRLGDAIDLDLTEISNFIDENYGVDSQNDNSVRRTYQTISNDAFMYSLEKLDINNPIPLDLTPIKDYVDVNANNNDHVDDIEFSETGVNEYTGIITYTGSGNLNDVEFDASILRPTVTRGNGNPNENGSNNPNPRLGDIYIDDDI